MSMLRRAGARKLTGRLRRSAAVAGTAVAASLAFVPPAVASQPGQAARPVFSGNATYYSADGLSACGTVLDPNALTVAVNQQQQFGPGNPSQSC